MENLLKGDSGSDSEDGSGLKSKFKGRLKAGLKRTSFSAHNYHFSQIMHIKDGLKMDQIEEKVEATYSAEIKNDHMLEALQKLKAKGYS